MVKDVEMVFVPNAGNGQFKSPSVQVKFFQLVTHNGLFNLAQLPHGDICGGVDLCSTIYNKNPNITGLEERRAISAFNEKNLSRLRIPHIYQDPSKVITANNPVKLSLSGNSPLAISACAENRVGYVVERDTNTREVKSITATLNPESTMRTVVFLDQPLNLNLEKTEEILKEGILRFHTTLLALAWGKFYQQGSEEMIRLYIRKVILAKALKAQVFPDIFIESTSNQSTFGPQGLIMKALSEIYTEFCHQRNLIQPESN